MKGRQDFSFCCSCQRLSLIIDKRCYFCSSTFVVSSPKNDYSNQRVKLYHKNRKSKNTQII